MDASFNAIMMDFCAIHTNSKCKVYKKSLVMTIWEISFAYFILAFVDKFLFSFITDCFALNLWNFISLISLQYPINSVVCNKLVCGRFTSRNRDVIKILSANVAKWF